MTGIKISAMPFLIGLIFFPQLVLADADFDADGLSNDMENKFGTQVYAADSDGDGFTDIEEIRNGFSPLLAGGKVLPTTDADNDKLLDWQENWFGTDINRVDTDGDGFTDYDEVMSGHLPTDVSTSTELMRNIIVDKTKQQLHYTVDSIRILSMPVSTGNPGTQTPNGEFAIQRKIPVMRYTGPGYDLKGVTWNMQFLPHYYLHTAYWHNDFGKRTHSHGCVNLKEADAALLYKYGTVGQKVTVIGNTPKHYKVGT